MDQKRTLWIAIAAGLFLLVVIGAALFLYAPAAKKETKTLGASSTYVAPTETPTVPTDSFAQGTVDPQKASVPADGTSPATDGTADHRTTDNLTAIANGTTNVIGVVGTNSGTNAAGTTTIDLNALKATPSPVTAQNKVAADAMAQTSTTTPTVTEQTPVQTVAPTAPSKTETSKKASSTPTTKKATSAQTSTKSTAKKTTAKLPDSFWVQAASYATKKNADEARATLDANKIPCEVFTYKDAKGKLFYRVRVGPYTTKSEAEYWKDRITAIDLFAKSGSYVTNTSAPKK